MELIIAENGKIFTICTDCGAEMTCLNHNLARSDVLQFRCDNEQCGKLISVMNQKDWEPKTQN